GFAGWRYICRAGNPTDLIFTLVAAALVLAVLTGGVLPRAGDLQVSKRLAAVAKQHGTDAARAITGYHEPSAVFLMGTELALTTPQGVADHLRRHPAGLAFVEARMDPAFQAAIESLGLKVAEKAVVQGLNYSRGRPVTIRLYTRR